DRLDAPARPRRDPAAAARIRDRAPAGPERRSAAQPRQDRHRRVSAQPPGALYSGTALAAASTCSGVSSTVVLIVVAPERLMLIASAAAISSLGRSQITRASASPKAKWKLSIVPPIEPTSWPTASRRAVPPFSATP